MRSSNSRARMHAWKVFLPAAFLSITVVSAQRASLSAQDAGPQNAVPIERLVVIDAAHGGSETGAMLNPAVPEKDVNLVIARRLRQELTNHGVLAQLLREGDATLTDDQRAAMVNAQQRKHPRLLSRLAKRAIILASAKPTCEYVTDSVGSALGLAGARAPGPAS